MATGRQNRGCGCEKVSLIIDAICYGKLQFAFIGLYQRTGASTPSGDWYWQLDTGREQVTGPGLSHGGGASPKISPFGFRPSNKDFLHGGYGPPRPPLSDGFE